MNAPTSPFPHLQAEVAQIATLSAEERFEYIDTDRWLPYEHANDVLAKFEDLLSPIRNSRPHNILLVGRSGNGKSHILDRFSFLHPGNANVEGPNIIAPVMHLETPPSASADSLYDTILYMLNQPRGPNRNTSIRREAAKNILRIVETKVLMLDEINHLLSGPINRQREFMFALKHLSNELKMSIVIAGTPESEQLMQVSDQIENRFERLRLFAWTPDKEFRNLLANFEEALPLRNPSRLSTKRVATLIHSFGVETIGATSKLLCASAKEAIQSGAECITEEILKKCAPKTKAQINAERRKI